MRGATRGDESRACLCSPPPFFFLARGARGVRLWGRTPRACRWRLRGQLEPGVWRAAARLQTFSFCKSRAQGSPLSAVARCSLLPRAGELLQPTLAASSWGSRDLVRGRSCSLPPRAHSMRDEPARPSFGTPGSQCMRLVIAGGRFFGGIPRSRHPLPRDSHPLAAWGGVGEEGVNFLQIPICFFKLLGKPWYLCSGTWV